MKNLILAAVAIFTLSLSGFAVAVSIDRGVDYAVGIEAERKAENWSKVLVNTLPDIAQLIETGVPTDVQRRHIDQFLAISDVFRFKLFDDLANVKVVSDELAETLEEAAYQDHDDNAASVIQTGKGAVSLNDGRQKTNRPALYSEAYVPLESTGGEVIGVVEVYVDQTATSALFHDAFRLLAIALGLFFVLAFGLPSLAFFIRNQQVKNSHKREAYLANYDVVSNVMNRAGFTKRVHEMVEHGELDLPNAAMIYLDIDHFKIINDTYGHNAGDAFLNHVGRAITQSLADQDAAGRLGGDEFAIMIQRANTQEVIEYVDALRAAVTKPLRRNGETIIGHISIGVHFDEMSDFSLEKRMAKADTALYQAKIDGRDTYRIFTDDLETNLERRRAIEAAIRTGLEADRFDIHYQPLLDQKTKECLGFEALLRLDDANGDAITPTEFIPVAESMGLINKIGGWVLEKATKTATTWPDHLFVSVNLSARQFDDNNLPELVKQALNEAGLDAKRLELEVTESLLVQNTEQVGNQLAQLRKLGVSIAMDDFGTGYSSLGYLWQFGFDKLKIDRSFIMGLDQNSAKSRDILDTIIMLGHRLDMTVTAEGIETLGQAELLSSLACDQFQGYLYGKPMPEHELAPFFLKRVAAELGQFKSLSEKAV